MATNDRDLAEIARLEVILHDLDYEQDVLSKALNDLDKERREVCGQVRAIESDAQHKEDRLKRVKAEKAVILSKLRSAGGDERKMLRIRHVQLVAEELAIVPKSGMTVNSLLKDLVKKKTGIFDAIQRKELRLDEIERERRPHLCRKARFMRKYEARQKFVLQKLAEIDDKFDSDDDHELSVCANEMEERWEKSMSGVDEFKGVNENKDKGESGENDTEVSEIEHDLATEEELIAELEKEDECNNEMKKDDECEDEMKKDDECEDESETDDELEKDN